jgi:hypothetical protein
MNSDVSKGATILAVGMVGAALVFLLAVHIGSARLSKALVEAGSRARPSLSGTHFPSRLQIDLTQEPEQAKRTPEERRRLMEAFRNALEGQETQEDGIIQDVTIEEFAARQDNLDVGGTLRLESAEEPEKYRAYLGEDGFSGFTGSVVNKEKNKCLLRFVRIE